MPRYHSHIRSLPDTRLHETLTLVGFVVSYFALMAVIVSSTAPFLSDSWATVWPTTLVAASFAASLIVCGLLVWPKHYRGRF
jgi:hypothetical protein